MMDNSKIYTKYMYSYPHKTAYNHLNNIEFENYVGELYKNPSSLYLHIPFCSSKCGYCNLLSIPCMNEEYMNEYIKSIDIQRKQYGLSEISWDSFIIGGGTPLILNRRQLSNIFNIASKLYVKSDTFKVIETSPNETMEEKLKELKGFNFNRISIGVQSFIEVELKALKRNHSKNSIHNALSLIKKWNFEILNIDIIYGIKNQTIESLKYSIDSALKYVPEEIFIYPLYNQNRSENIYEMYGFLRDYLKSNGYFQTSMRRFVLKNVFKEGKSCGFENSLALGTGGRSYLGSLHSCSKYSDNNTSIKNTINNFINADNKIKIDHGYILNSDELKRRYVIKNLFYYLGISKLEYKKLFQGDVTHDFPILNKFCEDNYAKVHNEKIILTDLGMSLSDYLGPMFISETVSEKMESWKKNV